MELTQRIREIFDCKALSETYEELLGSLGDEQKKFAEAAKVELIERSMGNHIQMFERDAYFWGYIKKTKYT